MTGIVFCHSLLGEKLHTARVTQFRLAAPACENADFS